MKISTYVLSILTAALAFTGNAHAVNGGNGPGNGTDEFANQVAFKALLDNSRGLTVEEKIYDLWQRAENSVPNIEDTSRVWVGLGVVNYGETQYWKCCNKDYPVSKYQKYILLVEKTQEVKIGEIQVKPETVYAMFAPVDDFDGDLNPERTFQGQRLSKPDYENSSLKSQLDKGEPTIKPAEFVPTGMLVKTINSTGTDKHPYPPIEYRQINENTLVGVRKAVQTEDGLYCPGAKKVRTNEKRVAQVTHSFFGLTFNQTEETQQSVTHYEFDKDYGVPGVCEVHYLIRSQLDSMPY